MNSLCVRAHVLCRLRSCAIALGGSNNAVAFVLGVSSTTILYYQSAVFSHRLPVAPPRLPPSWPRMESEQVRVCM